MRVFVRRLVDVQDRAIEMHLVCALLGVLTFLGLSIYVVVVKAQPFDPAAFGQGLGLVFLGTGAAALGQGLQRRAQAEGDAIRRDGPSDAPGRA